MRNSATPEGGQEFKVNLELWKCSSGTEIACRGLKEVALVVVEVRSIPIQYIAFSEELFLSTVSRMIAHTKMSTSMHPCATEKATSSMPVTIAHTQASRLQQQIDPPFELGVCL